MIKNVAILLSNNIPATTRLRKFANHYSCMHDKSNNVRTLNKGSKTNFAAHNMSSLNSIPNVANREKPTTVDL